MKLLSTAALVAASVGLAVAHDEHVGQHIPKLLGGRKLMAALNTRGGMAVHDHILARNSAAELRQNAILQRRQDESEGRCGAGIGSCQAGYCCSAEGSDILLFLSGARRMLTLFCRWCGKTKVYCSAPDCQINYSAACDGVGIG